MMISICKNVLKKVQKMFGLIVVILELLLSTIWHDWKRIADGQISVWMLVPPNFLFYSKIVQHFLWRSR